jgi:hypothetical protein
MSDDMNVILEALQALGEGRLPTSSVTARRLGKNLHSFLENMTPEERAAWRLCFEVVGPAFITVATRLRALEERIVALEEQAGQPPAG